MEKLDQDLNALFEAYRRAIPDREPSSDFTPKLWAAIDARRTFLFRFRRMSQLAVAAALGICLIVGGVSIGQHENRVTGTYVDVLAEAHPLETLASAANLPDLVEPER
jgi:hypothetical protein